MVKVLIFSYYSFKDPVFQSAVLPYFTEITYPDHDFLLLTFEHEKYVYEEGEIKRIEQSLKEKRIFWFRLKWRSGSFKPFKKLYDLVQSMTFSLKLIQEHRVNYIYSEGFPGAILGYFITKKAKLPHIVHSFEPHGEYMLEAGVWNKSSWEYKLQKYFEKTVAKKAFAILTATLAMAEKIQCWGTDGKIFKVPSCVDTNLFKPNQEYRNEIRRKLHISERDLLFVYLGKFGGMYMDEQFFELLKQLQEYKSFKSRFLIISTDDHSYIWNQILNYDINRSLVNVVTLSRDEVPKYLNAGDFGVVAVKPYPSKRYCSPIKDGEYWACGLPIIIPEGVSDDFIIAEEEKIGIVWKEGEDLPPKIEKFYMEENMGLIRDKCYSFVKKDRSMDSFVGLYRKLFSSRII